MQLSGLTSWIGAPHPTIALVFSGLSLCHPATAAAEPPRLSHIGILVRNLSAAPAELVQKAEAECQRIYHSAGIRIAWMNSLENVTWRGPEVVLQVVILPQAPPSRAMGAFGTALRGRREALIYHDRVVLGGKLADLSVQSVLSVALMHEIGHLLLDSDEHSPFGIMRAEWDRRDLNAIGQGLLRFTSDQSRLMNANIDLFKVRTRGHDR